MEVKPFQNQSRIWILWNSSKKVVFNLGLVIVIIIGWVSFIYYTKKFVPNIKIIKTIPFFAIFAGCKKLEAIRLKWEDTCKRVFWEEREE